MRVFYRVKTISNNQTIPFNYNIANALEGALQLGLECIPYLNVDDIFNDYQKGDIVLDGVKQVQYCLSKFGITIPSFDYPEVLNDFLGRKVWKNTISSIANDETKRSEGYFVKPIKEKAFTGRIVKSFNDLIGCESAYEDYEVLVSEPIDIVYECRGFVYYDKLKDLRPYKGDFKYMKYMDTDLISKALSDWETWDNRPNACSLDFGVIKIKEEKKIFFIPEYHKGRKGRRYPDEDITYTYKYKTVLIEGNLPYALGCYGYPSVDYIKLISAYISQISGVEDELHF